MLKSISELGSTLNKSEQKSIKRGRKDCAGAFVNCDRPDTSHDEFNWCMEAHGCGMQ